MRCGPCPALSLPSVITDGTPLLSEMALGIGFSGTNVSVAQPLLDVWVDDVIVNNAPVACTD